MMYPHSRFLSYILVCLLSFIFSSNISAQWQILKERNFIPENSIVGDYKFIIADGSPYIVYNDRSDEFSVRVIKFDGTDWLDVGAETLPKSEVRYPNIAVDGDFVYIAYSDLDSDMKTSVMKFDGTSWSYVGQQGFSADEGRFQSIAVYDGVPYVAFEDKSQSLESSVMKYDGDSWAYVGDPGFTLGITEGQSIYNKISFDQEDLYIIFMSPQSQRTYVMRFDEDEWVPVGDSGFQNAGTSTQTIDFYEGEPYFSFLDRTSVKATVKKYNGSEWVNVGMPGFSADLADSPKIHIHNGIPFVAYRDFSVQTRLTVMYFTGDDWLPLGGVGVSTDGVNAQQISAYENKIYVAYADTTSGGSRNLTVMIYDLLSSTDELNTEAISFDVYPNPATDQLIISTQEMVENVTILSLDGKMIKKYKSKNINLEGIQSGFYLLQVQTDKGVGLKRVFKD